jgi:magnesium transporter
MARLRGQRLDYVGSIYVLDRDGRLLGHVPLTVLVAADPERALREFLVQIPVVAQAEWDQERAASAAIRQGLEAVPVVDAHQRLLGVLTPATLMGVLRSEHVEDIHRLSGTWHDVRMAREAIEAPPLRRARHRLPWLLIGLAGSAVATVVMAGFEATLTEKVSVAYFLPGIVYLADAIGTQTEAAAVRGLSLSHEPLAELVWGELRTGVVMGSARALIALPAVWLAFGELPLAAAVSFAIVAAGTVATTIGLVLPWLLARFGRDPAYGSGPLATVIQDVLSIVIYLAVVTLVAL